MNCETKYFAAESADLESESSERSVAPSMSGGGLCHCTMPNGGVSSPVSHKTVKAFLYFIQGLGRVWRKLGDQEQEVEVDPGVCLTVSVCVSQRITNNAKTELVFLCFCTPQLASGAYPNNEDEYCYES